MLHSLVLRLNAGPNARMRAVLVPAQNARTDTNALFTLCTYPVGNIDEAPLHYPRTMPSTRVELCVRWFCFCGAGRFETSSSVVTALSVVCPSSNWCGEDSVVRCLGVICFLSSVTPGWASVFESARRFGDDSTGRCVCFFF